MINAGFNLCSDSQNANYNTDSMVFANTGWLTRIVSSGEYGLSMDIGGWSWKWWVTTLIVINKDYPQWSMADQEWLIVVN